MNGQFNNTTNYFDRNRNSDIQVITASGEFVYQALPNIKKQFYNIYQQKEPLILDLSQVVQIDSTGFGFILNIIKQLVSPTDLILVVSDEFILELFMITKVDKLVKIVRSLDLALIFLKSEEKQ